jgi:nucleoside permease NupC
MKEVSGVNKWRSTYIKLVVLELVLSVIFTPLGYVLGNPYFRGVGVGLLIAWVTGALAYFVVRRRAG